jgi:hypothetical protein
VLSCRELTELAPTYLDGNLGFADRMRLRLHLALCVHCRRYIQQVEATRLVLVRLGAPELPPNLHARLLAAYLNTPPGESGPAPSMPPVS